MVWTFAPEGGDGRAQHPKVAGSVVMLGSTRARWGCQSFWIDMTFMA
jgi:hypothetical protein